MKKKLKMKALLIAAEAAANIRFVYVLLIFLAF